MNPSNRNVLIYDGQCGFCRQQVESLKKLVGQNAPLAYESFHTPGILAQFPKLTYDECMKEIKLVTPEGEILGGAQAIFYALSLNPIFLPLRWIYPIPGLKQIIDFVYQSIAKNRYKIQMKDCPSGTCHLHNPS